MRSSPARAAMYCFNSSLFSWTRTLLERALAGVFDVLSLGDLNQHDALLGMKKPAVIVADSGERLQKNELLVRRYPAHMVVVVVAVVVAVGPDGRPLRHGAEATVSIAEIMACDSSQA